MFETPQEVKPSASMGLWIGIAAVVVLVSIGGYLFLHSRNTANKQAAAGTTAQLNADADPIRDLKIQRVIMNKDRNGTMAVWAVTIENKSTSYSYRNIKYETTYIGADDKVLMVNQGTIADTIGPGEQNHSQVNDPLYPAGTATYKMKITGATPAVP